MAEDTDQYSHSERAGPAFNYVEYLPREVVRAPHPYLASSDIRVIASCGRLTFTAA